MRSRASARRVISSDPSISPLDQALNVSARAQHVSEMPVDIFATFSGDGSVQDKAETLQQCGLARALAADESVETVTERNPRLRDKRAHNMKAQNSGVGGLRLLKRHAMAKG